MDKKKTSTKRGDVNCFRRCKRYVRKKLSWNKWPMRYQLRVHLFTLFGGFFLAFFIFLALYSKYFYAVAVAESMEKQWPEILQQRLEFSAQSVSTAFYHADKAFIDTVARLQHLY